MLTNPREQQQPITSLEAEHCEAVLSRAVFNSGIDCDSAYVNERIERCELFPDLLLQPLLLDGRDLEKDFGWRMT